MNTSILLAFVALYGLVGLCLVLFSRARPQVFDLSIVSANASAGTKALAFAVTGAVAIVLWPVFVRGWFRKPITAWDAFLAIPGAKDQGELYEALLKLCRDGVDADELPNGMGRFGLDVENPIPTKTVMGSRVYLSQLQTESGESVKYERVGSITVDAIAHPIDRYKLTLANGKVLGTIYVSPYHLRNSTRAPHGFKLRGAAPSLKPDSEEKRLPEANRVSKGEIEPFRLAMFVEMVRGARSRGAYLKAIEETYGIESVDEAARVFDQVNGALGESNSEEKKDRSRRDVEGLRSAESIRGMRETVVEPTIVPIRKNAADEDSLNEGRRLDELWNINGLKPGREFASVSTLHYAAVLEGKPERFRSELPLCQYTAGWICGALLAGFVRIAGRPKAEFERNFYDGVAFAGTASICNEESHLTFMRGIDAADVEHLNASSSEFRVAYERAYSEYGRMASGEPMFFPVGFESYWRSE